MVIRLERGATDLHIIIIIIKIIYIALIIVNHSYKCAKKSVPVDLIEQYSFQQFSKS